MQAWPLYLRVETTRNLTILSMSLKIMRENVYDEDFDDKVTTLIGHTLQWFRTHQDKELSLRFTLYVEASQSGHLQNDYACLLDGSQECMVSVLPVLVNHLAAAVCNAVQVSSFRLRPLLSMIVYWLFQYHADNKKSLPGRSEMQGIINSSLSRRF